MTRQTPLLAVETWIVLKQLILYSTVYCKMQHRNLNTVWLQIFVVEIFCNFCNYTTKYGHCESTPGHLVPTQIRTIGLNCLNSS